MRVLVCGGRDFDDYDVVKSILDQYAISTIISGEARGADSLAKRYALEKKIEYVGFPAQWGVFGKSAGYKRNLQMIEEGLPNLVIAFPGGKGTGHMINIANEKNVKCVCVSTKGY